MVLRFLYTTVFKSRPTFICMCPFGFAAVVLTEVLFAYSVQVNNKPDTQMLQTDFMCSKFILISILIAAEMRLCAASP